MTLAQFRDEAVLVLSNMLAAITEYLAIWIEDEQGRLIASRGPATLIAASSDVKPSTDKPEGTLALFARLVGSTFVLPLSAAVRDTDHALLGTIMVLVDFNPIASMLMDSDWARRTRRDSGGSQERRRDSVAHADSCSASWTNPAGGGTCR